MNDQRLGLVFRLVRQELRLRQADVATRAGVAQRTVSEVELGRIEHVSPRVLRTIGRALNMDVTFDVRLPEGRQDRLVDRRHAAIVDHVVQFLRARGWAVEVEYTFNHFGERGAVDVLAWHEESRALALLEVKSSLTDIQSLHASIDRKARIVPGLLRSERGWQADCVGRVLVVIGSRANRTVVATHAATFASSFPGDTGAAMRWLRQPRGSLAALWFVSPSSLGYGARGAGSPRRVRRPRITASASRSEP